jgi:hypothetical protein
MAGWLVALLNKSKCGGIQQQFILYIYDVCVCVSIIFSNINIRCVYAFDIHAINNNTPNTQQQQKAAIKQQTDLKLHNNTIRECRGA